MLRRLFLQVQEQQQEGEGAGTLRRFLVLGGATTGILLALVFVQNRSKLKAYQKKYPNLLPYTFWPVLGQGPHLLELFKQGEDIVSLYRKLGEEYNGVFTICLPAPIVVVTKPSAIRQVLLSQAIANRVSMQNIHPLSTLYMMTRGVNGVIAAEGEDWKLKRRVIMSGILSAGKMDELAVPIVNKEVVSLLQHFHASKGSPLNPDDATQLFSMNIICELSFGKRYTLNAPDTNELQQFTGEWIQNALKTHPMDLFPQLNYIYWGHRKNIDDLRKRRDNIFLPIIDEYRSDYQEGVIRNVVDTFIAEGKSNEEIVALLVDLIVAGTETTAYSVLFFMGLMVNYPHIQKRIQEEIDAALKGTDKLIDWTDTFSLPYLKAVIKETLRFLPVAHFTVPHVPDAPVSLDGITIDKGTPIWVFVSELGRNPTLYPDPDVFNPDRHLSNVEINITGSTDDFSPFGMGPRLCVGYRLSKTELFVLAANILYCFNLKSGLPGGAPLSLKQRFASTAYPATPLSIIFEPRRGKGHLFGR